MILGNIGGKYAAPYIAEYQAQLNELNAEINRRIQEQIKVPDLGIGQNLPRFENEQYNEFVARVNQANAELQRMASRPEVQQLGQVAGLILAVGAASAVLYDWCTNEPGKAVTAVGGDGSSARGVVVPGTNGVAGVRVG